MRVEEMEPIEIDAERSGPLPMSQVLDVAAEIADALEVLHRHGIVHGDVYAFGCAVYRMITGQPPLPGPTPLPLETPARLADAIERCLGAPADRPTVPEVIVAIARARDEYARARAAVDTAIDDGERPTEESSDDRTAPAPPQRIDRATLADQKETDSGDDWSSWYLATDRVPDQLAADLGWIQPPRRWFSRVLPMSAAIFLCVVIAAGFAGLAFAASPTQQLLDWLSNAIP